MKGLTPQGIQENARTSCVVANKSLCLRARHETEFQGFGRVRGKEAPQIFLWPDFFATFCVRQKVGPRGSG
jgi:hypothetical protein